MEKWRLLDVDWLTYADTAIFRPVVMRARAEGLVEDTFSMCTFSRPSIALPFFNDPEKELDLDLCKKKEIPVGRIIGCGGPIFGDPGYMLNMLVLGRDNPKVPKNQAEMLAKFLTGVARGLSEHFNVECRFRPLNDVEIRCPDGVWRKIGPSGCMYEQKAIQATSCLQVSKNDTDLIASVITPAKEKFLDKETKTIQDRITYLEKIVDRPITWQEMKDIYKQEIEKIFEVELIPGRLSPKEELYYEEMRKEYTSDDYFMERSERRFGVIPKTVSRKQVKFKVTGGPFVRITTLIKENKIEEILLTGSIHASPLRPTNPVYEIEKALKGQPIDCALFESIIKKVMSSPGFFLSQLEPDFLAAKIYGCAIQ